MTQTVLLPGLQAVGLNLNLKFEDPLALPGFLTALCIPTCYILNHLTGNVSWVDRIYTSWPVLCSMLIGAWARGPYIASLPRLALAIAIQWIWCARLTYHTARRGLYNPWSEDYRYPIVRRLVPKWFFEIIIHIIVVVIAQPLLIFSLTFPLSSAILPPSQMSYGPFPWWFLALSSPIFRPLHATALANNIPLSTPVLHAGDALAALMALGAVWLEKATDDAMYAFQEAKHAAIRAAKRSSQSQGQGQEEDTGVPKPVDYPPEFYPGFPTHGLHAVVRHPNFAGEQTFWLAQALLGLGAGPLATRAGGCLLPPFLLSLLFLSSTTLTEWITTKRYPAYAVYKQLVGKFTPMDTAFKYIWTTLRGTRAGLQAQLQSKAARPE